MADEIVVKYVADVNGFKAEMKSTQDAIKATATEADIAGASTTEAFAKTEKSTQSLRTQLKNLKAELAVATDPKDIERLARAAGDITDKLDDATQAAKIFASESKFEQIRTALGGIGRSVASLDFKQAASQAKLLQSAVASLTFKEALGGLKNLGSTFLSIGKTLLVNPIFLIAATVTAIGVAVFALKDKIPLLTKAFDAVGEAVKKVKNFITGITDSLGFTTVATDKAFDRLIELGKQQDEQRARRIAYQEEEKKKAEELAALQKKIQEESIATYQVEYDMQSKQIKDITDERKKAIDEKIKLEEDEKKRAEKKLEDDKKRQEEFTADYLKRREEETEAFDKQMEDEIKSVEAAEAAKKQKALEAAQAISDITFAFFQLQDQQDQARLANFKGTEAQKEALTKRLAADKAKRDRAQALFDIAIRTAVNIVQAGVNIPLAVAMGIVGGLQAAAVLARPIPKFAKGTDRVKGGVKGQDSVHALLMPDEAIITANQNMATPGLAKAWNEGRLDEYINKNFVLPKISELLSSNGSTAERMATSAKVNFPDEYALARVMSRNKGVQIENADYLANKIAKSLGSMNTKRGWA
jgi:hypothetical protein